MATEAAYRSDEWRAARVPLATRTVSPDLRCGEAYAILAAEGELPGLAVVDAAGIHGLIDRHAILARFAQPIMRDVYEGRPVTRIMDPQPLIVEADLRLDELSERIAGDNSATLVSGFIVVRDGIFLGVGRIIDVIHLAALESRRRAEAIEAAQDRLIQAEKLASLGALVAGVAHEINTPIGIGLTAASTLSDTTAAVRGRLAEGALRRTDLAEFLDRTAETSQLLVTHMRRAAELVQSFKRVAVDRASAERRRFELQPYLEEVLVSLQPAMKRSRIRIALDCPDALTIDSYPGALSQVIVNFTMNSLIHAYEPEGEGTLRICVRSVDAKRISLTYADDGAGIPADVLPHIFDPFFTTRRGQGGSGLGLHIVYNIVTGTLGGEIQVASRPGEGTRFTLTLPVEAPAASEVAS